MVVARGGWPRWSLVALTLVGGTLAGILGALAAEVETIEHLLLSAVRP